jgi:hypothetical protein
MPWDMEMCDAFLALILIEADSCGLLGEGSYHGSSGGDHHA